MTASFGTARVPGEQHARLDRLRDALPELDLLTADDVCGLLKVKKSWLYDTVEAGTIAVIRLGKQLRFQPSAIADYLASGPGLPLGAVPRTLAAMEESSSCELMRYH